MNYYHLLDLTLWYC